MNHVLFFIINPWGRQFVWTGNHYMASTSFVDSTEFPILFNLSIPIRTQTQCVKTIFLHCSNLIQLFKELEHCPLLTNLRRVLDFYFYFLLFLYFYIKYLEIWQTNISDWVSQIMMTLEHKRELPVPVIF